MAGSVIGVTGRVIHTGERRVLATAAVDVDERGRYEVSMGLVDRDVRTSFVTEIREDALAEYRATCAMLRAASWVGESA